MRKRIRASLAPESGFTLVEVLVVVILIGILAAIALVVFLNQREKGSDASTKSDVNNLARLVQLCNQDLPNEDDYTLCDSESEALGETGLELGSDSPLGNCSIDPSTRSVTDGTVRVLASERRCFVVLGISASGNRFWYVKRPDGTAARDCMTRNTGGCPADGEWAG